MRSPLGAQGGASRPFEPGPILSGVSASARARRRILTSRIPVRFMAEGSEGVGHLKNVSRAGMCVRSEDLPRPGVPIAIQFEAPSTGELVNLRGEVRWSSDRLGPDTSQARFGVLLHEPPPEFRDFFRWAIEQLEKEDEQV
jgi:hypothetical protein